MLDENPNANARIHRRTLACLLTWSLLSVLLPVAAPSEAGRWSHWRQHRRARTRLPCQCCNSQQGHVGEPTSQPTWQPLFDGETLDGWKITNFGGEGEVNVKDGTIQLAMGSSLSGITYAGTDLPTSDYEIQLEARRRQGIDFFCGLTFPVADSHCSFIVAGWAGAVVGLSSIDGRDASDNETTKYMSFKNDQWYKIRVRVTRERISAWIDGQQVVSQDIRGRKLSIRPEVELSCPLGLSTWETSADWRNIMLRRLSD